MKISKEIKAGLIALIAIISFVLLYQFMKGKSLFTTDDVYYAKYDNVEGLEASSAVSLNGLKVGQVDKIIPITDKSGKIHFVIKVVVDDEFKFPKGSTLEIFEPGLMSGKQMRINMVYGGPIAKDGDTLTGAYKPSLLNGLSSQVKPVKDQLQNVLLRIDSLTNSANKVMDAENRAEVKSLLINLNRTVAAFEQTSRNANSVLSNNDGRVQKVLDNANLAVLSANTAVGKYGNLADNIDVKKLNSTVDNLDKTVNNLNSVIADIKGGKGSLGKIMNDDQLYNNLEQTSKNLNDLVIDLKTNPKRYLNISVFGKNNKD